MDARRAELDRELVTYQRPYDSVAQDFALPVDLVLRHRRDHLPWLVAQVEGAKKAEDASDLTEMTARVASAGDFAPLPDTSEQFHASGSALFRNEAHIGTELASLAGTRALASTYGLADLVEGLIHELNELKAQAKQKRDGGAEARRSVETILKAVQVLADLTGMNASKLKVNLQQSVPSDVEAIEWSKQILLEMLTAEQMLAFVTQLQERVREMQSQSRTVVEAPAASVLDMSLTVNSDASEHQMQASRNAVVDDDPDESSSA